MHFSSPVTQARMGRPPLHVEETKVRLTKGAKARIVALVGAQRMAAFIREAVDAELDRRESGHHLGNSASDGAKPKP